MADKKPWERDWSTAPVGNAKPWERDWSAGGAAPAASADKEVSWKDLPGNIGPSLVKFGGDLIQPFLHPVETAKAIGDVAAGAAAKVGIGDADQTAADSVAAFFADRYGGWDNVKKTMIEDPVGFLADAATVLTGGAALGARAPGVAGTLARAAGRAASAIDPATNIARAVAVPANAAGKVAATAFGVSTGAGDDAIREVARAGREGNVTALEQMRAKAPIHDLLDSANYALDQMKEARGRQYRADMAPVYADPTVLKFDDIDRAISDAVDKVTFKGVATNEAGLKVLDEMATAIAEWKLLDPAEYHTAAGLDALKKKLGTIRQTTQEGTPARTVANEVYHAVSRAIEKQLPNQYSAAMRAYSQATDEINEIKRTLSLNERATRDTAIRKLLSTTRSNVNTNFGHRQELIDNLAKYEPTLPGALAGRALEGFAPQGLARAAASPSVTGWLGLTVDPVLAGPAALASLAISSPRVIGETAYKIGSLQRQLDRLTPAQRRLLGLAAFQTGRATKEARGRPKTGQMR